MAFVVYRFRLTSVDTPFRGSSARININALVMMTPRSGVSVDDDEVDDVGDEIGDVDDNEVDGVGDKVGGINMSVQCVDFDA